MCVAGLNVSTQPCNHRWYYLMRSCQPDTDLSNCPERLRLEGWETRNEVCPWCEETDSEISPSTHRLFGSASAPSTSSSSSSPTTLDLSAFSTMGTNRRSSGSTFISQSSNRRSSGGAFAPATAAEKHARRASNGTLNSLSSLSRHNSTSSVKSERAQRHRQMNDRLHLYMTTDPDQVLPSARKNRPSSYASLANESLAPSDMSVSSYVQAKRRLRKTWRRSVRLSREIFRL